MELKGRKMVSLNEFTTNEIEEIVDAALEISTDITGYGKLLQGYIMGALFYEASTRTRLSFESAMLRLGGKVVGFADASTSSSKKGESLADTIRVMDDYCDIIVLRHPKEGSAKLAGQFSTVPIINAGDGGHKHPTQTLTDLVTLKKEFARISNLKIALCGDLRFGRTVHSMLETLSRWKGNSFVLISPEKLRIPEWLRSNLEEMYIDFTEITDLETGIERADVLYMTRIQKERFFSEKEYLKLKNAYILDVKRLKNSPSEMIVMHPLPRVNEIDYDVDNDDRSRYFQQAANGVPARMALLALLLGRWRQ